MATITTKRSTVKGYEFITGPCKTKVKVRSTPSRIIDQNTGLPKWIINFNAIADHNASAIMQKFAGKQEIEVQELNGLLMSFNILENNDIVPVLPAKGEEVEVTVGYVYSKRLEMDVLAVQTMRVLPVIKAKKFTFDDELEESDSEIKTVQATSEVPAPTTAPVKGKTVVK